VEYTRAKAGLKQARNLLVSSQKSIAVGRLLGSIAHEINNHLRLYQTFFISRQGTSPILKCLTALSSPKRSCSG